MKSEESVSAARENDCELDERKKLFKPYLGIFCSTISLSNYKEYII
jgi:hypothetical protein